MDCIIAKGRIARGLSTYIYVRILAFVILPLLCFAKFLDVVVLVTVDWIL